LRCPEIHPVAQADVDRFIAGERRYARSLLRDLEPHAALLIDMIAEPRLELGRIAEGDHVGKVCTRRGHMAP